MLHLLSVDVLYEIIYHMIMDILKTFGTNIRKYRKNKCLSQEKLAELAGLHRTYISDIERFQRSIALENIQKLSEALEIEVYKLFMEE